MKSRGSSTVRRLVLALAGVLGLGVLAGCAGMDHDGSHSNADHNARDIAFANDMIQHHAQALAMVNLTVARPLDPEFKALAEQIREAQAPEIETMADWLTEWNQAIPETSNDHMHAEMGTMPEGTEEMPGMMSAGEMASLKTVGDDGFQKLWLEMMIRHHQGAIEMAEAQLEDGKYQPAVTLAESIISAQRAEIAEMERLLTTV